MKVYAVLIDSELCRVGLNFKDATLSPESAHFEGLISLFGGTIEDGESPHHALARELNEEIPGFVVDVDQLGDLRCFVNEQVMVFVVHTNLSGDGDNRQVNRIGELARVCNEGDGIVRSYAFIRRSPISIFAYPIFKEAVLAAMDGKEV